MNFLKNAATNDFFVEITTRNDEDYKTMVRAPSFAYGFLFILAFFIDPSLFLKVSFVLQSAATGVFFAKLRIKITMALNNNGSDKAGSPDEFRLWFVVHFGYDFSLKMSLFFKVLNRRLLCEMTVRNDNGSDKAGSPDEFRLWFLIHFGFFIDPSLFSKMSFVLQSAQPAAISGNGGAK